MSAKDDSFDLAMRPFGRCAGWGSPVGLGQTLSEDHRRIVVATDIKGVWKDGAEIGWVYHGSDNRDYYQENRSVEPQKSYGADVSQFVPGAGALLAKGHVAAGGDVVMPSGDAPIVQLPPGDPSQHLPAGGKIVGGIDHANRHPDPRDGRQFHNSPETIGDQIPAVHGTTAVVGINALMDGQTCVGWVYKGADGNNYYQVRNDTTIQPGVHGSIGPVSGSTSPAQLGPIQPFHGGVVHDGIYMEAMDPQSRIYDDKLGEPSRGNDPASVIHANADVPGGNPTLAALGVNVGESATISGRGGQLVANVDRPAPSQQLGRS